MRKNKLVTRMVQVVDSVICNCCGETIEQVDESINVWKRGGFYSKIGDGVEIEFDLCEDCLITITESFKIPIYITEEDAPAEQVSVNTILPHSKNPGILEAIENVQPVLQRIRDANNNKE